MNIQFVSKNGSTTILINEERLDIQNASELQEILIDLIYKGNHHLLLDLRKVEFIDSSGLGALVYGLREARKAKGNIKVACLSEHVSSMFSITRLNKIFEIV